MRTSPITTTITIACASLLLAACEEPTTSSARTVDAKSAPTTHEIEQAGLTSSLVLGDPFRVNATFEPFFINQAPELMLRSSIPLELVIQRLVTAPGAGAWHTHRGPSFGKVEQGQVMITRYTKQGGCSSVVYGPGQTYYEVADEIHRATVVGPGDATEYKVRFNTPVGGPLSYSVSAEDIPDC
jgi:hypothetical protein